MNAVSPQTRGLAMLRAWLIEPAEARTWEALCAMLDAWPDEQVADIALPYLEGHVRASALETASWEAPARWAQRIIYSDEPRLALCRAVRLASHSCGDTTAAKLASVLGPHLMTLTLSHNSVTCAGASALADASQLRSMQALELAHNEVGDAGLRVLLEAPPWGGLQRLDLSYNKLTNEGARWLARQPLRPTLQHISLIGNPIGPEGLEALEASPWHALIHTERRYLEPPTLSALPETRLPHTRPARPSPVVEAHLVASATLEQWQAENDAPDTPTAAPLIMWTPRAKTRCACERCLAARARW